MRGSELADVREISFLTHLQRGDFVSHTPAEDRSRMEADMANPRSRMEADMANPLPWKRYLCISFSLVSVRVHVIAVCACECIAVHGTQMNKHGIDGLSCIFGREMFSHI